MKTTLPSVKEIADAVLYEGYILYPYRPSAKKNVQRFTFGRVYPQSYSLAQNGAEPCLMQTQCLARDTSGAMQLVATVRFLQPMNRLVKTLTKTRREGFTAVPELRVDGKIYQTWQEAVERELKIQGFGLSPQSPDRTIPFCFPSFSQWEQIPAETGEPAGIVERRRTALKGTIELHVDRIAAQLLKITLRVTNTTPLTTQQLKYEESVLLRTLASAHAILEIQGGEFISLTDPPDDLPSAAEDCKNIGVWPVLVGNEEAGQCDTMLASPIILYDYPQIARDSAGNYFDGLEIDELLNLRIQTLTADEKEEMRAVDQRARRLLERTESLNEAQQLKVHGLGRTLQSFDAQRLDDATPIDGVTVGGVYLRVGDRVRIRPQDRADLLDLVLAGKIAVIEALEQDAEGKIYLAVVAEDDPGKELGWLRQPGHRFFYGAHEIEPLESPKGK